jgi:class 3 adenylate cyclase
VHAAARVGAAAIGDEVLVTRDVLDAAGDVDITNERELELKGFAAPVAVATVPWQ